MAKKIWQEKPLLRHFLIALGLGFLLALFGPFGSYPALDRVQRYEFWISLTLFGYCWVAVTFFATGAAPLTARLNPPLRFALTVVGSSVPQGFATAWTLTLIQPGRIVTAANVPALFLAVASVQLVLTIAFFWSRGFDQHGRPSAFDDPPRNPNTVGDTEKTLFEHIAHQMAAPSATPPFMTRIPAALGTELLAVEANDHYLRIHMGLGSHLIHMRMIDALEELRQSDGLQVHRGWWVASHAVCSQTRKQAQTFLTLANGITVPVSRTFLNAVRKRHWPCAQ